MVSIHFSLNAQIRLSKCCVSLPCHLCASPFKFHTPLNSVALFFASQFQGIFCNGHIPQQESRKNLSSVQQYPTPIALLSPTNSTEAQQLRTLIQLEGRYPTYSPFPTPHLAHFHFGTPPFPLSHLWRLVTGIPLIARIILYFLLYRLLCLQTNE